MINAPTANRDCDENLSNLELLPFDNLVGVTSGATKNPAILVYLTRMASNADIGYAMIFRSMTIVKVITLQSSASSQAGVAKTKP